MCVGHLSNGLAPRETRFTTFFSLSFPIRVDKVIRDNVEKCTGNGGMATEDYRKWCLGWVPTTSDNCTEMAEYDYTTATELKSTSRAATLRTYGGGGYILRLTGFIEDLEEKINLLKHNNWVDNRTRALIVEFSVYNAQVKTRLDKPIVWI